MPVTNWNRTTIDGKEYLVVEVAQFRIPLNFDPDSNMFIAVAAPSGGLGNFPALVKGDPGFAPTFNTPTLHALEHGDPTADSIAFTLVTPGTALAGPVYHCDVYLHKGEPGDDGTMVLLDASDLTGTPLAGRIMVVNSTATGMEFVAQKVGDRYLPASINSTPSGNANYTLCPVGIPAQPFDWRPEVVGQTVVAGTGTNVRVDLLARLSSEAGGNVVARCFGVASTERLMLCSAPPAGSNDAFDRVAAGTAVTIYMRVERQSGSDTFTTSASTTSCAVRVRPIP